MDDFAKAYAVNRLLSLLGIQGLVDIREQHFGAHMLGSLAEQQVHPVVVALLDIHVHDKHFNKNLRHGQVHLVHVLRYGVEHVVAAHGHQGVLRLDHLDLRCLGKRCRQKLDYVFCSQVLKPYQQGVVGRLHLVRANEIHPITFPERIVRTAEQVLESLAHGNPGDVRRDGTFQFTVNHGVQLGLRKHLTQKRCERGIHRLDVQERVVLQLDLELVGSIRLATQVPRSLLDCADAVVVIVLELG